MKTRLLSVFLLFAGFWAFAQTDSLSIARDLAEKGFWDEAYIELEKVPKTQKNSDYQLLEAFAKVMTNQASFKDEQYILKNASLENRFIMLLKSKQYKEITKIAEEYSKNQLSKNEQYLVGLAYLGQNNYEKAENYLGTESVYALFYTGICQFAQGKVTESSLTFEKITKNYPAHKLGIESHIYNAKCHIIQENYDNAIKEAKFAINKSVVFAQKADAALLLANLYQSLGSFNQGIDVLEPLVNSYTSESIPLKFKLSELYLANNDVYNAAGILEKVQNQYEGTIFAEEAAFRRGQIYFENEDFFNAKKQFTFCSNNFSDGNLTQQSIYYNALTSEKLSQIDEAVLLYQKLTEMYPESTYSFYACERLVFLFFEKGEYQRALSIINKVQEIYPKESTFSSVNNIKSQIELILSGTDKDVVVLLQQWNYYNRANSVEGMKAGLELASKYLLSVEDSPKGKEILVEILSKIDENTTSYEKAQIAAEANNLMALYSCVNAEYVLGSEYYLKAASFLMGLNHEAAAESMYKAALALSSEKKYQDVRLVYNKMKGFFASSPWVEKTYLLLDTKTGD